jgi:Tfp pilus assembly major pilin PilA
MKKYSSNQKGFSMFEAVLVVLVIATVATIGYVVMQSKSTSKAPATASATSSTTGKTAAVPTKASLQQSATTLNNTNVDSIDLTQIDIDLNSML